MPLWKGVSDGLGVGWRGNRHLARLTTEPKRGVYIENGRKKLGR